MTAPHAIPAAALDDRLFFGGTAGSGKTYGAGTAVERLLSDGARVVIPDPLGVWWGLALAGDGKQPSLFRQKERLVIFGGPRGDLGLTENSGALIGETVAGMAESCILDLSELKTGAAERRFMLAFLSALYAKKTREPLHVVFDEADLWAPQRVLDREGEAMKLLGMMENICRRGRVKGFIPWLISQRPAVISKNVLSQIDGMIAFKLTSVQDRDAIGDWVQGQADKAQWAKMWSDMPTLERGRGLVWLPARGILKVAQFPAKTTFDSSRTPERGKRLSSAEVLQPLNLDKLKERLSKVEADAKANDPRALRAQIEKLKSEKAALERQKIVAAPTASDPRQIEQAEQRGFEKAKKAALREAEVYARETIAAAMDSMQNLIGPIEIALAERIKVERAKRPKFDIAFVPDAPVLKPVPRPVPTVAPRMPSRANPATPSGVNGGGVERPLQRIIDSIAWWNVMGIAAPTHPQVAFVANFSHKSGTWATYLSRLRSGGYVEGRGDLVLTPAGAAIANPPDAPPTGERLREIVIQKIDNSLRKILSPILQAYPEALSHEVAGEAAGFSPKSGTWATYLSRLRSLDLIEGRGELKAQEWLFP